MSAQNSAAIEGEVVVAVAVRWQAFRHRRAWHRRAVAAPPVAALPASLADRLRFAAEPADSTTPLPLR
ncbi:hypothetical protein [Streptomyces yunnanensis]|uniref:hypothetical protein n=1 Tax=Streptomyces yunnanensis TaxID=156453 RepID=UPI00142D4081|nr:hypothetical protein [Streptomyces yunnanensis]